MTTFEKFTENLKDFIFEEKCDAKTFANKIGLAPTCITRYLRGERSPSIQNLVLLANYFNCTTDYLLGLTNYNHNLKFKSCPPFAERLKQLIKNRNCTCLDIAHDMEINETSVYSWKNGKRVPNLDNLLKLSKFFDCSVDYLLGREN